MLYRPGHSEEENLWFTEDRSLHKQLQAPRFMNYMNSDILRAGSVLEIRHEMHI